MRNITRILLAVAVITMPACQKEQITPSNPDLNPKPISCNRCEGGWDLTDTIPANP